MESPDQAEQGYPEEAPPGADPRPSSRSTDAKPSPDWLALAETTRRDHDYAFRLIKQEWPSFSLAFAPLSIARSTIQ